MEQNDSKLFGESLFKARLITDGVSPGETQVRKR